MIDRRGLFTLGIGIVMTWADSNVLEGEFRTYGTQAPATCSTPRR